MGGASPDSVTETPDIGNLFGPYPFSFLGDGRRFVPSPLGNGAHLFYFWRIDHLYTPLSIIHKTKKSPEPLRFIIKYRLISLTQRLIFFTANIEVTRNFEQQK
jgi:hypothetical protein